MTRWQRRGRRMLAVLAVAVGAGIYLSLHERPRPPASTPAERRDPTALLESTGAELVQLLGGTERVQVEAKRQFLYADGRLRLEEGVRVRLPSPDRREVIVTAERAEVQEGQNVVDLDGAVRLASADGAQAEAAHATYDHRTGLVKVTGPVRFVEDRLVARGVGATYDRTREVFEIHERPVVEIREEASDGTARVTARTALYARAEQYWRFDGEAVLVRGTLTGRADQAIVHLTPDEQRIRTIELQGSAQVEDAADQSELERMAAEAITLDYGSGGAVARRAILAGAATLALRGSAPGARRIVAAWMALDLTPDGRNLSRLAAQGGVEVALPARGAAPARRIRARTLELGASAGDAADTARFSGAVEFREATPSPPSHGESDRVVRADTLEARIAAGLADLTDARFAGNVVIRDGDLEARAVRAQYRPAEGRLHLDADPSARIDPRVVDPQVVIEAQTIDIDLDRRRLVAAQSVRSEFLPVDRTRRPEERVAQAPRLMRADRSWYATAGRLVYETRVRRGEFTGEVKLFQDDTVIEAATLVIDENGNLDGLGGVRTRVVLERVEKTGARVRTPTLGRAGRLRYDEALKRVTYMENARLSGEEGEVWGDRIDLYLQDSGQALDRIEAAGRVRVQLEKRTAAGDRLRYEAANGQYLVAGTPVSIVEDLGVECHETRGRLLTFFRSTATISVDGDAEHRTRTKTGGKCPALPLQ